MKSNYTITKELENPRFQSLKIEQLKFVKEAITNMTLLDIESYTKKSNKILEYLINVHGQSIDDATNAYRFFKYFLETENLQSESISQIPANTYCVPKSVSQESDLNCKSLFNLLRLIFGGISNDRHYKRKPSAPLRKTSSTGNEIIRQKHVDHSFYRK